MSETLEPAGVDLTACDREPIHIPEAIQPHGLMFVLDGVQVVREAGRLAAVSGRDSWLGSTIDDVLDLTVGLRIRELIRAGEDGFAGRWRGQNGLDYDVVLRPSGALRVVEVEQSSQTAHLGVELISRLDQAGQALERAPTLKAVCEAGAEAFRALTGYDRILIYRFLEDASGQVVAESKSDETDSFLNHHFPATDIPVQARALYVRNPVRVIPDADYTPAPLTPPSPQPLDMGECALRSVSPIHLKYLLNMGVRASASVSIIIDGDLWGLVACHSARPQLLPYELRTGATNLARSLARQIKAKGDADLYRDRVRLRQLEDRLISRLNPDEPLEVSVAARGSDLIELLDADGVAVVGLGGVFAQGVTPDEAGVRELAAWVAGQPGTRPIATHHLGQRYKRAADWTACASGLLGVHMAGERPLTLLAFRAEMVETIRWAGNPATAVKDGPNAVLTPRASFEAWSEMVRGRSRRWNPAQLESASRLRVALADVAAVTQLRGLNRSLQASLNERDLRLEQQSFLIREVNHRVQNSLTLVSSFLGLQARRAEPTVQAELLEARRRVRAVSMVHSRLYKAETGATVDMARYFDELIEDISTSVGPDWASSTTSDLAPIQLEAGRAVTLGLILTELIINAQKYAYDGHAGPLHITLEDLGEQLRLMVRDQGRGGHLVGNGFGSMMINSLVTQLAGTIEYRDGEPGLKVVMKAPIGELG